MNEIQPKTKASKASLAITALVIIVVAFFVIRPQTASEIKNIFSDRTAGGLLSTLERTISNSGKLIANVDFSNAFLTNSGTFALTNTERTKAGHTVFAPNAKLSAIAKIRMNDMFAKEYFEHVSPSGDSAAKEADIVGYEYISIGENIALGNFKDDATLVLAWMNSPGHRANILNPKFSQLGVSVGKGMYNGKTTWIAVQVFGKPLSSCPEVDLNLKNKITGEQSQIDADQTLLIQRKVELDTMSHDTGVSRAEYNQKVDEYNVLVNETNALIVTVKRDIGDYNVTVRAFNDCLASAT